MKNKAAIVKLSLLSFIILVLPVILYFICKDTLFCEEWFNAALKTVKQNKVCAAILVILFQIIQIIICLLPGQPIQLAASYIFGTFWGYLFSIIGAIIGMVFSFYIAKLLGASSVEVIFGKEKVVRYKKKINSEKGLLIILIIYLVPGLPKDLLGYVAGISRMSLYSFLIISAVGRTPPMFGSLLIGKFLRDKNYIAIAIVAAICIFAIIISFIKRKTILNFLERMEKKNE